MHSCKDTLVGGNRIGVALTINLTITSSIRDDAIALWTRKAKMHRTTMIIAIASIFTEWL